MPNPGGNEEATGSEHGEPTSDATDTETGSDPTTSRAASKWRADRPKNSNELGTLWVRWTDGGSDLQFHRICEILPQVQLTQDSIWPSFKRERGHYPTFKPLERENDQETAEESDTADEETEGEFHTADEETEGEFHTADEETEGDVEEIQFRFLHGLPRQLLRHVPLLILVSTIILFGGAELTDTVGGVSDLVQSVTGTNAVLLGLFVAISPLLLWLLTTVGVVETDGFVNAVGVYGLVIGLGLGTAISILFVLEADHPTEMEPNVVLISGYLLTLLVGGMLLYEAVLRTEHMFVKLHRRDGDIVSNSRAYRRFLTELHRDLNETTIAGLSPSRLFGFLFALQFFIIWTLGSGPQGMDYLLGLGVNFVLNVILVTIVFQFFVLVRYFNQLMNETKDYSEIGLRYEPFHIDGHGGFRDFGRFATRVNAILMIAGLYLVYRLYVIGGRELPVEGFSAFSDSVALMVWLISFAGPVLAYIAGIVVWGYYSFWSIHRKMERDKKLLTRRYQGKRGPPDANRVPSTGDNIEDFEDAKGPEWASLQVAPTWPLDVNKLASLISGNFLPLLVPVVDLLL